MTSSVQRNLQHNLLQFHIKNQVTEVKWFDNKKHYMVSYP